MSETNRQELVKGLHAMAEFFDQHPEVRCPLDVTVNLFIEHKKDLAVVAKAFGAAKKDRYEEWFWLQKDFSANVAIHANARREKVCKKVLVGVERVEEQVIPARPEEVVPAHDVEKYEWQCDESLLEASK